MVKSMLIIMLAWLLSAAAALTRPNDASFKTWYRQQADADRKGFLEKLFGKGKIDSYLDKCEYKDHVLWADIAVDGKVIYSGAFDHWFARESLTRLPVAARN